MPVISDGKHVSNGTTTKHTRAYTFMHDGKAVGPKQGTGFGDTDTATTGSNQRMSSQLMSRQWEWTGRQNMQKATTVGRTASSSKFRSHLNTTCVTVIQQPFKKNSKT